MFTKANYELISEPACPGQKSCLFSYWAEFACMHVQKCTRTHTCSKQESRLSSVSWLKTASVSVTLSIYICVWELASVPGLPPLGVHGACVSALCVCLYAADRQVTLAEQVEAAAMRSSERTQDRHGPGRWPKEAQSGEAARQLVCVSMFMEYAFTPTVNLGLVPRRPQCQVTVEGNGHVAFFHPLHQNWTSWLEA